jgi:hypothetical protein
MTPGRTRVISGAAERTDTFQEYALYRQAGESS